MSSPRRRSGNRGRIILISLAVIALLLYLFGRGIAGFWTDYLWFQSLGRTDVWRTVLGTKVLLALLFSAAFFVVLWVNLVIADRLAPRFRPLTPEDERLLRYQEFVDRRAGLVRVGIALFWAIVAGVGMSQEWNSWLLFTNRVDFGIRDPQFGVDTGFYIFQLPFLTAFVNWLFAAFVLVIVVVAAVYYLNGGIRVQPAVERVSPQVKRHLSVLLAVLALIKAADYWLQRYGLVLSTRGAVDGATYTDVKAQLPALNLLILMALAACVLFLFNVRRKGWVLPVLAVGLWAFMQIAAGTLYPAAIQRFVVTPAQSSKEAPYIARNIEATRRAYGLDRINQRPYQFDSSVEAAKAAVDTNPEVTRNVSLLDPKVVTSTFQRFQSLRSFYQFPGVDSDRYTLRNPDGTTSTRQVVIGARELDTKGIPPQSGWEGPHLAYTHGFGLALASSTGVADNGQPDFLVRDIPMIISDQVPPETGTPGSSQYVEKPEIYFGEGPSTYAVVGTRRQEVNYIDNQGNAVTTSYSGTGGVQIGSALRRLAFALRFNDTNLLISSLITRDSKVLYVRDVRARALELAPFLQFDTNPYPVVTEGRMVYVVDGYTTSATFPFSQRGDTIGVPNEAGSLSSTRFNYIRNSVKAVVDAYDGTVSFYVMETPEPDPIIAAYRSAFPGMFQDASAMSEDLRAHLRYPQDMFRVQTAMYARYHLTDPKQFFDNSNAWSVPPEPRTRVNADDTRTATPASPVPLNPASAQVLPNPNRSNRVDPVYQYLKLPDRDPEFVVLRPYVQFSEDDSKNQLTAFVTASSDPDTYGQLTAYTMPNDLPLAGPTLIDARILQDGEVSRTISLLNQQGSNVDFGSMLLVPLGEGSIVYVRPLYVTSSGQQRAPELKYVITVFGDRVVMKPTLRESLAEQFPGSDPQTFEGGVSEGANPTPPGSDSTTTTTTPGDGSTTTTTPGSGQGRDELLDQAVRKFDEADEKLRAGDAAGWAAAVKEAEDLLRRAQAAGSSPPSEPSTTTTSPPSSTTTTTAPPPAA